MQACRATWSAFARLCCGRWSRGRRLTWCRCGLLACVALRLWQCADGLHCAVALKPTQAPLPAFNAVQLLDKAGLGGKGPKEYIYNMAVSSGQVGTHIREEVNLCACWSSLGRCWLW